MFFFVRKTKPRRQLVFVNISLVLGFVGDAEEGPSLGGRLVRKAEVEMSEGDEDKKDREI